MIQRVQSVYLALAILLLVLSCCMPLATFTPADMQFPLRMHALVVVSNGTIVSWLPTTLLTIIIVTEVLLVTALLSYKRRRRQMTLCSIATALECLWIVAYVLLCIDYHSYGTVRVTVAAAFPVVAIVVTVLARRGVKRDEALVRAADRIR